MLSQPKERGKKERKGDCDYTGCRMRAKSKLALAPCSTLASGSPPIAPGSSPCRSRLPTSSLPAPHPKFSKKLSKSPWFFVLFFVLFSALDHKSYHKKSTQKSTKGIPLDLGSVLFDLGLSFGIGSSPSSLPHGPPHPLALPLGRWWPCCWWQQLGSWSAAWWQDCKDWWDESGVGNGLVWGLEPVLEPSPLGQPFHTFT